MSLVEEDLAPKLLYPPEAPFEKWNGILYLPVLSQTPTLSPQAPACFQD